MLPLPLPFIVKTRVISFLLFFYTSHSFATVEVPRLHAASLQTGFYPAGPEFSVSLTWQMCKQCAQLRTSTFPSRQ